MTDLSDLINNVVDCARNDGAEKLKRQSERTVQAIAALRTALAEQKPQVEGYNTNRDQGI
jgi:hypothetical protein